MSTDVKVFGKLRFSNTDDLEDVEFYYDEDDESCDEISELIEEFVKQDKLTLSFNVNANLTADANMLLQDWLEDLVDTAKSGLLDTWQESFDENTLVRLHAGGKEETVKGKWKDK
jgi:molybdopterin converting factor small subunit